MIIRRARAADLNHVERVTKAAYTEYISLLGREPTPMQQNYGDRVEQGEVFVLEEDGQVHGSIVIEDQITESLIYSVVVAPSQQGRGLGQALLEFAEDLARSMDHTQLRLCTGDKMARNLIIYQKFGFRETGREDLNLENSPTIVWMAKSL